ncbi:hypothetical protein JDV09_16980 [Mycobacterium sp. Y57]|uniref:hypothetical protein n=1 Tax=Mycolicibacterium xanthum TaxID=2796469 RepID=UPI001C856D22|nr:hypothetical protein [Mycolicibacterium xanthum]MBX7433788.1 hypothetical protein [Mycolicibacterium xanthum]
MSADLDAYERLGDLDAPFTVSTKDERRQQDRQRLRNSMHCEVAPLTYEQFRAGQVCPGCGRPYLDTEPSEAKGIMNYSDSERACYDREEARFKEAHRSCGSHSFGVSGSLTKHCSKCCPPPPFSPAQRDRLATLLRAPTPDHDLMVWQLRLYCGHTVERRAHASHKTVHAAFTGSTKCAECGCEPAIIIDARAIGLVAPPPNTGTSPTGATVRKPTRAALEKRITELEAEVARLHANSDQVLGEPGQ